MITAKLEWESGGYAESSYSVAAETIDDLANFALRALISRGSSSSERTLTLTWVEVQKL